MQYKRNKDAQSRLSTPEIKLIFIFVYYTLLGVVSLYYYSISLVDKGIGSASFQEYYRCESLGLPNNCSKPCKEGPLYSLVCGLILTSFITSVNLIYVINWSKAKLLLRRCLRSLRGRNSDQHVPVQEVTTQLHLFKYPLAITSSMFIQTSDKSSAETDYV